jgi:hypothetical protein
MHLSKPQTKMEVKLPAATIHVHLKLSTAHLLQHCQNCFIIVFWKLTDFLPYAPNK